MKRYFGWLIAITISVLFHGCCGYQGYAIYDTQKELSRENERIVNTEETLQISGQNVKLEKTVDYTYDADIQVDTVESYLFTPGSGGQVIGNFILYPLYLVGSPFVIFGAGEKTVKEFGREYKYSHGRQVWNALNPLICTLGDRQEEKKILSSKKIREKRTRSECLPIKEGKIQFVSLRKKEFLPVNVSCQKLHQLTFDYPLPQKTERIALIFNGKTYPFTLDSTAMLKPEEKAAWAEVLNCKTGDQALNGKALKSLEILHQTGKISDSTNKTEKARLDTLVEALKFPMKKISDNRLPLTKDLVSGVSFQWTERQYGKSSVKNKILEKCQTYDEDFDGFCYSPAGKEKLIFSCGEPFSEKNAENSVLVRREVEMPSNITRQMIIDSITKKNPGITVKNSKELFHESEKQRAGITIISKLFDQKTEIRNEKQQWLITQRQIVVQCKGNRKLLNELGKSSDEEHDEPIKVIITDRKFGETFAKMKKARLRKEEQERVRKEQEEKKNVLDQL